MISDQSWAIGVDLGGTNLRVAAVHRSGEIRAERSISTNIADGQESVIRSRMIPLIQSALSERPYEGPCVGVGVGAAGIIRFHSGTFVRGPQFPDWRNVELGKILSDTLNVPVRIENDANAATWGEGVFGTAREFSDFVMVTLGTGVGGGIVSNRRLVRGAVGMAGEFGHIRVGGDEPDPVLCGCGHYGCVETYASGSGLCAQLIRRKRRGEPMPLGGDGAPLAEPEWTARTIADRANQGDVVASELLRRMGEKLGMMLAAVINILNPEAICVHGGLVAAWPLIEPPLRSSLAEQAWREMVESCEIRLSTLEGRSGILGAASLWFEP